MSFSDCPTCSTCNCLALIEQERDKLKARCAAMDMALEGMEPEAAARYFATLKVELDESRAENKSLRELCAVVNRDGGHRMVDAGVANAIEESVSAYYKMVRGIDKLKGALEKLMKCTHHVEWLRGPGEPKRVELHAVPIDDSTTDGCECYKEAKAALSGEKGKEDAE